MSECVELAQSCIHRSAASSNFKRSEFVDAWPDRRLYGGSYRFAAARAVPASLRRAPAGHRSWRLEKRN